MSYSTIHRVTPGVGVSDECELSNSHGSAPVVWGALAARRLGQESAWLFRSEEIWKLWHDLTLPVSVRAVLGMTFDRVYIEREHFRRAAADIRSFLAWATPSATRVNHWPAIAELLEKHADDESFPAMGITHTSCSECLFLGDWNEELEEYGQPDWSRFWSLYPDLDGKPEAACAS